MLISAKYVLQFSRRNDCQNTGIEPAIENRRFGPLCLKLREGKYPAKTRPSFFAPGPSGVSRLFSQARRKAEGSISYNYRFHIVTRFKS